MAAQAAPNTIQPVNTPCWESNYRADRIIVQFKSNAVPAEITRLHARHRTRMLRQLSHKAPVQVVELPAGKNVRETVRLFAQNSQVEYAEPDYRIHAALAPNDPYYADGTQWGLNNTGQNGGVINADIDAPEGWELQRSASNIIVAIIDSGVRYTHRDLADNIWKNPNEIPNNGLDDDQNGYVDDVLGINLADGTMDPNDDFGHGTHVAGIVGAVGNNNFGISGVAWHVQLMVLKCLDNKGDGSISDAVECLLYAKKHGAKIVNASWGDPENSMLLRNAIAELRDAGVIVVAAAGNSSQNTEIYPFYPGNYTDDNIVTVTAFTSDCRLADYANYSSQYVALGAPGTRIYSTGHGSDESFVNMNGTSMAAPFVSGTLALLWARFPHATHTAVIDRLLTNTVPVAALAGKTRTGGRASLCQALGPSVVADFIANPSVGTWPLEVNFTNTSIGPIQNVTWDFGDGSAPSTLWNPTHRYNQPGDFIVTLTVYESGKTNNTTRQTITAVANYQIVSTNFNWLEPAEANPIILSDNGVSEAIALPFPFYFYGRAYQQIHAGANGVLGFEPLNLATTVNTQLPNPSLPNALLCPYWDNLNPAVQGSVQCGVIGTAPDRLFVISWVDVPKNSATDVVLTFQAVLAERSQEILFQYLETASDKSSGGGRKATVGLEMDGGTVAALYSFDGQPHGLTNQQALLFVPGQRSGLVIQPEKGFALSEPMGGPFSVSNLTLTLINQARSPIHWHFNHENAWLAAAPNDGSLEPNEAVQISVVLTSDAMALSPGTYHDVLQFVNPDGSPEANQVDVTLVIRPSSSKIISAAHLSPANFFAFRVSGEPDRLYQLETSTNLIDWIPFDIALIPATGFVDIVDTNTVVQSQEFFRVRPVP